MPRAVVTAPLTTQQWDAIGWEGREVLGDDIVDEGHHRVVVAHVDDVRGHPLRAEGLEALEAPVAVAAPALAQTPSASEAQVAWRLLDYVAVDYAGAVADLLEFREREGESAAMSASQWRSFAERAPLYVAREKAKELGADVAWDCERAKTPEGYASGSFGPTTAGRMDSYVERFQAAGGSMVMLAKGNRSKQVTDACGSHGGFYLGSIGGPAARLAQDCIRKVEVLEYPELGMEAIWKIEVEDFPAFIVVDDKGEDFFASVSKPVAFSISTWRRLRCSKSFTSPA